MCGMRCSARRSPRAPLRGSPPSLAHAIASPCRLPACRSARVASRPSLLPARAARRASVQPKALAGFTEVAQLAESEAGFIFGVSGVMVAITLIVSGWDGPRAAPPARRRQRRCAPCSSCAVACCSCLRIPCWLRPSAAWAAGPWTYA